MNRIHTTTRLLLGALLGLALGLPAANLALAASAPTKDPMLRIETGNHLAPITRISSDASGRWIVTASEDKTARLWDAQSGQPLAVLRPPIGAGAIGAVYAASISPDGRTVAMGGNTDFDGNSGHLLQLFDRSSASVLPKSTIPGLEAPITQLAWSRDSQYLAVGMRQQGLRLFKRNLQLAGSDPEYNEAIFGADFSADGKLAVASLDGAIRLYQIGAKGLTRLARKTATTGAKPYAISFSADGRTLAVGYQDRARVDLLDASTLAVVHSLELKGGNLGRVVWSADASTLFVAGSYSTGGHFPVLALDQNGRGAPREVGQFSNTVMALAALPGGSVAAASAEPAWAVFDPLGKTLLASRPQSADFRDAEGSFKLSPAADLLAFRFSALGEPLVFDVVASQLKTGPAPATSLMPRQRGDASSWKNSGTPRFAGRTLQMLPGEVARSLAQATDERSFVLGSDWFVRHYSADGALLWERRMPAAAWAVNVSGDGRWVVAGLGDGSVRWMRLSDGAEQLALFVHGDRTRWIAWSPSGYYDTSVGGEGLIGWHLNRAFNQSADFFGAGRFRDKLYRPDLIARLLASGGEQEALRQATPVATAAAEPVKAAEIAQVLPPVVDLRSDALMQTGANTVAVRLETRSPNGAPVTGLKTRVNGKLVGSLSGKGLREAGVQQLDVPLPVGDAEIQVFAENKFGKSEPATIKVVRSAEALKTAPHEKYEKLYLLVIGISKYPGKFALEFPSKDASDFSNYMRRQKGRLYDEVVPRLLLDQDAGRTNVLNGLKWLRDSVGERDAGVVFLAGHGDKVGNTYYFIPGDPTALPGADIVNTNQQMDAWKLKNAPAAWVTGEDISKTLLGLKGRAAFFIDTCHSGQAANQAIRGNPNLTGALNEINDEKGVIIFASSTGNELSQEDEKWGNGAFTKAIIEGVSGKADNDNNGLIRPSYLSAYVNDRVRSLTGNEQRPVVFTVGIDDPIAVKTQ
jgi:WD40 repeat protein